MGTPNSNSFNIDMSYFGTVVESNKVAKEENNMDIKDILTLTGIETGAFGDWSSELSRSGGIIRFMNENGRGISTILTDNEVDLSNVKLNFVSDGNIGRLSYNVDGVLYIIRVILKEYHEQTIKIGDTYKKVTVKTEFPIGYGVNSPSEKVLWDTSEFIRTSDETAYVSVPVAVQVTPQRVITSFVKEILASNGLKSGISTTRDENMLVVTIKNVTIDALNCANVFNNDSIIVELAKTCDFINTNDNVTLVRKEMVMNKITITLSLVSYGLAKTVTFKVLFCHNDEEVATAKEELINYVNRTLNANLVGGFGSKDIGEVTADKLTILSQLQSKYPTTMPNLNILDINEDVDFSLAEKKVKKEVSAVVSVYFVRLMQEFGEEYVLNTYEALIIPTASFVDSWKYFSIFSSGKADEYSSSDKYTVVLTKKGVDPKDFSQWKDLGFNNCPATMYRKEGYSFSSKMSQVALRTYQSLVINAKVLLDEDIQASVVIDCLQLNRVSVVTESSTFTTFYDTSASVMSTMSLLGYGGRSIVELEACESDGCGMLFTFKEENMAGDGASKFGGWTVQTELQIVKSVAACHLFIKGSPKTLHFGLLKAQHYMQRELTQVEKNLLTTSFKTGIDVLMGNHNILKDVNTYNNVGRALLKPSNLNLVPINVSNHVIQDIVLGSGLANNLHPDIIPFVVYSKSGKAIGFSVMNITAVCMDNGPDDFRIFVSETQYLKNRSLWNNYIPIVLRSPSTGTYVIPTLEIVADELALAPIYFTNAVMKALNGDNDGDTAVILFLDPSARNFVKNNSPRILDSLEEVVRIKLGKRHGSVWSGSGRHNLQVSLSSRMITRENDLSENFGVVLNKMTKEVIGKFYELDNIESLVAKKVTKCPLPNIDKLTSVLDDKIKVAKGIMTTLDPNLNPIDENDITGYMLYVQAKTEYLSLLRERAFLNNQTTRNTAKLINCTLDQYLIFRHTHLMDSGLYRSGIYCHVSSSIQTTISDTVYAEPEAVFANSVSTLVGTRKDPVTGLDEENEEVIALRDALDNSNDTVEKMVICHSYAGTFLVSRFANCDFNRAQLVSMAHNMVGLVLVMDQLIQEEAIQMQKKIKDLSRCINVINYVKETNDLIGTRLDVSDRWTTYTSKIEANYVVKTERVLQAECLTRIYDEDMDSILLDIKTYVKRSLIMHNEDVYEAVVDFGNEKGEVNISSLLRRVNSIANSLFVYTIDVELDELGNKVYSDGVSPGFHGNMLYLFTELYAVNTVFELEDLIARVSGTDRYDQLINVLHKLQLAYIKGDRVSRYDDIQNVNGMDVRMLNMETLVNEMKTVLEIVVYIVGSADTSYAAAVKGVQVYDPSGQYTLNDKLIQRRSEINIAPSKSTKWKYTWHRMPIIRLFKEVLVLQMDNIYEHQYKLLQTGMDLELVKTRDESYVMLEGNYVPKTPKPKGKLTLNLNSNVINFRRLGAVEIDKIDFKNRAYTANGKTYLTFIPYRHKEMSYAFGVLDHSEIDRILEGFKYNLSIEILNRLHWSNESDFISDDLIINTLVDAMEGVDPRYDARYLSSNNSGAFGGMFNF